MLVLAINTFPDPSKIGPYADAEIATVRAHKAAGRVVSALMRADGKGIVLIWRVESLAEAQKHISELTFTKEKLMTTEVFEISELT
jgi:hypothetical protein